MTQYRVSEIVSKFYQRIEENRSEDILRDVLIAFSEEIMEVCGKPDHGSLELPKSKFMEECLDKLQNNDSMLYKLSRLIELIDKHKEDKDHTTSYIYRSFPRPMTREEEIEETKRRG